MEAHMQYVVATLLALAAHFSLTSLAPAPAGKGTVIWPFAADSTPLLALFGRPQDGLTAILSIVAGLSFAAVALYTLTGRLLQPGWVAPLVGLAVAASLLLYLGYFTPRSLLPLLLDAVLVWGVAGQGWAVLRAG
jgi:hypothetical protein